MDEELERKNKKLEDDPYDYNLKDALYTEESKVRAGSSLTNNRPRSSAYCATVLLHVATNDLQ